MLGIDASEGMIAAARESEGGNLEFRRARIEEMDFSREFDVVFSNAALHWVKDHRRLLRACAEALTPGGRLRFNFAGDGNCAAFNAAIRRLTAGSRFAALFTGFEWPWYMPGVEEYRSLIKACGGFADIRVEGETADRFMTEDELVRWLDQPSLVPFLERLPAEDKRAFRDAAVEAMLAATRRGEDRYFEAFRRIAVSAVKK